MLTSLYNVLETCFAAVLFHRIDICFDLSFSFNHLHSALYCQLIYVSLFLIIFHIFTFV